jgi:hypothetical protein
VLELLQRESPLDVSEHLGGFKGLLENASLSSEMKLQLVGTVTNAQTRLQKLHDSTEVWFNNSMDRVSGAYKRHTQAFLFLIGMVLACMLNADTIQMWKKLAGNDALRTAMAQRAARLLPALDTLVHDTVPARSESQSAAGGTGQTADPVAVDTAEPPEAESLNPAVPPVGTTQTITTTTPAAGASTGGSSATVPDSLTRAKQKYEAARMQLDSMELKLGWTREDWTYLGFRSKKTAADSTAGDTAKGSKRAAEPRTARSAPAKDTASSKASGSVSRPTYWGRRFAKILGGSSARWNAATSYGP